MTSRQCSCRLSPSGCSCSRPCTNSAARSARPYSWTSRLFDQAPNEHRTGVPVVLQDAINPGQHIRRDGAVDARDIDVQDPNRHAGHPLAIVLADFLFE